MNRKNTILKSTLLATSVVTISAVTNVTVHADDMASKTQSQNTPEKQIAKKQDNNNQQLSALKQQQTTAENQAAQTNADKLANAQASNDAKTKVLNQQLQDQINVANQQATDAYAQKNAEVRQSEQAQAVTENNAYQSQVAAQTKANDQAVANQQQANAQELANAAKHIVTPEQKQNQIDSATKDAQQALDQAKSDHDATVNKLNDQLANDLKQNAQQEQAAKNDLKQPNQADSQKQLDDAQNAVNKAQGENNDTQSALSNAKNTLSASQNALAQAQDGQKEHVANTINLPAGYIDAWKEYVNTKEKDDFLVTESTYPELFKKLKQLDVKAYNDNLMNYHSDPTAKQTPVTLNDNGTLSRDDIIKATQFAVSLLNPIREAIGVEPYKITNASIDVAQDVANEYRKDNWNTWENNHDGEALSRVAEKWNTDLVSESWAGDGWFGGPWHVYNNLTLNDLYRGVYNSILMLLFQDASQNYGHATDLLGVRAANSDLTVAGDNLGVSFEYGKGMKAWGQTNVGGFHFNSISDASSKHIQHLVKEGYVVDAADPNSKVNQPGYRDEIAIPGNTSQKQIADLQAKVSQAQSQVDQLTKAANAVSQTLNDAKAKLANLQKSIADAENSYQQQLTAINTKFSDQAAKLQADHDAKVKAENDAYQAKVDQLNHDLQTKVNAIKAQPENTDQLKTQLDQKLAQVKQDGQHKLDQLKQAHEARLQKIQQDAEDTLAAYKANLDKTAQAKIAKAQADHDASVKALNDNYTQLKSQLDAQQAKLVNDDQAQYNALATKLDGELTALKNQVLTKTSDHQTAQNKQVVAGNANTVALDTTGKTAVVLPNEEKKSVVMAANDKRAEAETMTNLVQMTKNNKNGTLPQTGNSNSAAIIALGALTSMFGLGLVTKKKEW
ncbi:SEC10/PgrA surface exclusion domain-containing protein [Limosilactobacillus reuteri]|uniref:SEC10/PgrA surface exclusion domain-containing protein n=1 Tax=Limosilactobacillus reuteri TaxID=1598 RepID=UPI001E5475E0|nr:SEC10/PgrA surface exclusion domain-containing protein [Limosilactobacillus reuteri]MCC4399679.1 SEC10/PgrA surface exclusion domain-containing protein [Limosilactobacillus reuteri]MCC4404324.1 SEC10/PgrA surface exclusion domain-containing protein [Limosilactobacillus reuteri]